MNISRVKRLTSDVTQVLCVLGVVAALVLRIAAGPHLLGVDLDVYLLGARSLLNGQPLYSASVHELFFTYPPFAAVLFEPLTTVNLEVARKLFTAGSAACLVLLVVVIRRALRLRFPGLLLLAGAAIVCEPVLRTIVLGQVNLYLVVLVVVDLLVVPPRWRGWLIGLATGIKIVPAVFVFYFAIRRDWGAVARAAAGFLLTVATGFLLAPDDSWSFWRGGFLGLGRFGEAAVLGSDNQSVVGLMMRITRDVNLSALMSVSLFVVVIMAGLFVARTLDRRGDRVGAMVALAIGGLLASPVSWTHHWVWVIPTLGLLASRGWWVSTFAVGALFTIGPMWLVQPGQYRELLFEPWQQLLAASYVCGGIYILIRLAIGDGPGKHGSVPSENATPSNRALAKA